MSKALQAAPVGTRGFWERKNEAQDERRTSQDERRDREMQETGVGSDRTEADWTSRASVGLVQIKKDQKN